MKLNKLSVVAGVAFLTAAASAGPEWTEGSNDGGSTPATARKVSSAGGGTLSVNTASGSTATALVAGDDVDLIEIYIASPTAFKFNAGFNTPWNACIYLFRAVTETGGTTSAVPLLAMDNQASGYMVPSFSNASGEMSTAISEMGESFSPGLYYIAITGSGIMPAWINPSTGALANLFPSSLPGSSGLIKRERPNTLMSWFGTGPTGSWRFGTGGVSFIYSDTCADAEYVTLDSNRPINNISAAGGGGAVPPGCANLTIGRDVWYRITTPCSGEISVSTCGSVSFDSVIAIYSGECDALVPVACNDDCAIVGAGSRVTFTPDPCGGTAYYVRVGSWNSAAGGTGSVLFTCSTPSSADLNRDGYVNGEDLGTLLGQWGAVP